MLEETLGRLELSDTCYTLIDRFNFFRVTGFIRAILISFLKRIARLMPFSVKIMDNTIIAMLILDCSVLLLLSHIKLFFIVVSSA